MRSSAVCAPSADKAFAQSVIVTSLFSLRDLCVTVMRFSAPSNSEVTKRSLKVGCAVYALCSQSTGRMSIFKANGTDAPSL